MIPCYVITLDRCKDRQIAVEAMMAKLNMPFKYVCGVDGQRLDEQDYYRSLRSEFPEILPERSDEISLLPGETGCFLSFIRALRNALQENAEYVLIVEDDVKFCFEDKSILEKLCQTDLHWDQLKLTYTQYPLNRGIWVGQREVLNRQFDFYFYWRGIIGTTCNIYSRTGIIKLLEHCPRYGLIKPIDALINCNRYFMDFLPVFVRPSLAEENVDMASTIISDRDNRSALDGYLHNQKFSQRKLKQLRNIARDLRHPIKSLIHWIKKSAFLWYCLKYLLWRRKK